MYCHILRVRAIPTLESTDSMINFQPIHCVYIEFKCTYTVHLCPKEDRKYIPTGMVTWCMISIHEKYNGFLDNVKVSTI